MRKTSEKYVYIIRIVLFVKFENEQKNEENILHFQIFFSNQFHSFKDYYLAVDAFRM